MKDTSKKEIDADILSLGETIDSICTIDGLTAVLSSMTSNARAEKETKDVSPKYSSLVKNVDKCRWGKLPGGKIDFFVTKFPTPLVYIIVLRAHLPFSDQNIIFVSRAEITWGVQKTAPFLRNPRATGSFEAFTRAVALEILNRECPEEDTPEGVQRSQGPLYKLRQTIGQKIELLKPALFATDIQAAQVRLGKISGFISQEIWSSFGWYGDTKSPINDALKREKPRSSSIDCDKGEDSDRSKTIRESMLALDTIVCNGYQSDIIVDICLSQWNSLLWGFHIQAEYIFSYLRRNR